MDKLVAMVDNSSDEAEKAEKKALLQRTRESLLVDAHGCGAHLLNLRAQDVSSVFTAHFP